MTLNELPIEVIDNICLQLRDCSADSYRGQHPWVPVAKKGLLNLCRTSKKLYRIARPHLYYHVNINYDDPLVPFIRLLYDHPHLGNLVHKIDLNPSDVLEHDQVLERYFSTQTPIPLPETWTTQDGAVMANGPDDVYAIRLLDFLLTKASNLEFFDLTVNHDDYFNLRSFTHILNNHASDTGFLSRLKEIVLRHWDTENGFDFEAIIPLLSITQVQKLTMWSCIRIMDCNNCSFQSLTELKLLDSGLSAEELARIIQWCPNLQHFSYTLGGALVVEGCDDLANPEEIGSVLLPLRDNLRTLFLYLPFEGRWNDDPRDPISSLVQLSRLESLTIDLDTLAGESEDSIGSPDSASLEETLLEQKDFLATWVNKLPRSLQNLCILRHWESNHRSKKPLCLELSLLVDRKAKFPNLKSLIVDEQLGLELVFQGSGIDYLEVEPHSKLADMY